MAKQKAPTPQDLYRQRRQREDSERTAYLPPGLINHGNTCFMNSVLQGLIATQLLSDLVHFAPLPAAVQHRAATRLAGQRSPQLTNGHNLSGPHDRPWVDAMPIGDAFLSVMYKAWDLQARRQKDILSPRSLLGALGKKYDQYLDFAQQDAHEFLRILLDAMRMEELDQTIKSRKRTSQPEDESLMSFVDMIFGGKLTSILVCQKCKHISQTYEDFNDISLSIKPEDYILSKRDRLRKFAKRLTAFPSASSPAPFHLNPSEIQRPSSVPPSPKERPDGQLVSRDEPPPSTTVRRRSLDIPPDSEELLEADEAQTTSLAETDSGHVLVNLSGPEGKHVEFVEVSAKKEKRRSQVEENWAKLGRRLSLGLGKSKDRKSRPVDKATPIAGVANRLSTDSPTKASLSNTVSALTARTPSPDKRPFLSPKIPAASPRSSLDTHRPPSPSNAIPPRSKSPKPPKATAAEAEYLRKILADVSTVPANPLSTLFRPQHLGGAKGLGSGTLSPHNVWLGMNQLSGIEECLRMFTAVEVLDGENMVGCRRCWKIANGVWQNPASPVDERGGGMQPQDDVEEEGDNDEEKTPRQPSKLPRQPPLPTSMSTPIVSLYADAKEGGDTPAAARKNCDTRSVSSLPATSQSHHESTSTEEDPPSSRTTSQSSLLVEERISNDNNTPGGLPIPVISTTAPLEHPLVGEESNGDGTFSSENGKEQLVGDGKILSPKPTRPVNIFTKSNMDSLPVPPLTRASMRRQQQQQRPGGVGEEVALTTDDDDEDGEDEDEESSADESDTSFGTSVSAESGVSLQREGERGLPPGLDGPGAGAGRPPAVASAGFQPFQPSTTTTTTTPANATTITTKPTPPSKKPSKPKPVIMRPAYKRYLISTPPPVLVIHLKRFQQQLAKSPFLSFSQGNFKKLDDDITFYEYLDLTPFLAPRKEDYGLGKRREGEGKEKEKGVKKEGKEKDKAKEERCMYRLYAVVVHIGNMLGGHYIAYVALPSKSPIEGEGLATKRRTGVGNNGDGNEGGVVTVSEKRSGGEAGVEGEGVGQTQASAPIAYAAPPTGVPPSTSGAGSSGNGKETGNGPATSSLSLTRSGVWAGAGPSSPEQPQQRQWAFISDTIVRLTTLEEVLSAKAYICMYERC